MSDHCSTDHISAWSTTLDQRCLILIDDDAETVVLRPKSKERFPTKWSVPHLTRKRLRTVVKDFSLSSTIVSIDLQSILSILTHHFVRGVIEPHPTYLKEDQIWS